MNDTKSSRWLRELRRAVSWHRRLLASGLAAGAVALTISALQPPPPRTVAVLAARHDLGGGAPLGKGDVMTVRLPAGLVPSGALPPGSAAEHLTLAAPVRRGEPLTDARIVGPGLLAGHAGPEPEAVAAPVRLADAEMAHLVRTGDRVDVLAADARPESAGSDAPARLVAAGVRVLAVPRPADDGAFGAPQVSEGALVVVETTPDTAGVLARAAVTARLSVVIRSG
jgi:pilus assembly protein CpaB